MCESDVQSVRLFFLVRMNRKGYLQVLVWFLLSIFLGIESFQLGLGTPSAPGAGFMPFLFAVFLFTLSIILFFQTTFSQKSVANKRVELRLGALSVLCSIVAYVFVYKQLGYLLSTFLLMTFLFKILGTRRWFWAVGQGILVSVLSYIVFGILLKLNLPSGIF
jgi:putative tricarboxylic transport membrane protein